MDRYGDCFRDSYISVKDEQYTILSQGGEPYDTTVCEMVFKSEKNDRLCLSFKEFTINRCDLHLDVYAEQSAAGTAIVRTLHYLPLDNILQCSSIYIV